MMDDPNNPYRDSFDEPVGGASRGRANVLGIVGFVFSFCLPPIGLLLSVIAAFKPPRAFAIAGIIVGVIGTAILALIIAGFVMFGKYAIAIVEVTQDVQRISQAASGYAASNNNAAPPDLKTLQLPSEYTVDPWGTDYRYTPGQDGAWTLESAGFDKAWGTDDDIKVDSDMDERAIMRRLRESMADQLQKKSAPSSP